MLKGRNLGPHHWEEVLPEALHSVRTLLSTATNTTPHERFLPFPRCFMLGRSLPTWLITPNTVLLRRFVRNKSEPLCDEVELLDANPKTALRKGKYRFCLRLSAVEWHKWQWTMWCPGNNYWEPHFWHWNSAFRYRAEWPCRAWRYRDKSNGWSARSTCAESSEVD